MTTSQMLSSYSKKLMPLLTHPASIIVGLWWWLPLGIGLLLTNNRLRKDYRWWGGIGVWIVVLFFGGRWSSKPTTNLENVEALAVSPVDNNEGNTGQKKTTLTSQSNQQDLVCEDLLITLLRTNKYEIYSSPASKSSILGVKANKRIRGSDLEWLAVFQEIEVVDIPAYSIDPTYVMRLPNLRKLAIDKLTPEDVFRLATCCPEIENLSFGLSSGASMTDYIEPLSGLPSLTHLSVSDLSGASLAGLNWGSLSSLETLELGTPTVEQGGAILNTLTHRNLSALYLKTKPAGLLHYYKDLLTGFSDFSDRCPALSTLSVGHLLGAVVEFDLEGLTQCKKLSKLFGVISAGNRRKEDELRIRLQQQLGDVWYGEKRQVNPHFSSWFKDASSEFRELEVRSNAQGKKKLWFVGEPEGKLEATVSSELTPQDYFENGRRAGAEFAQIQKRNLLANSVEGQVAISEQVIKPTVTRWEAALEEASSRNNTPAIEHFRGLLEGFWGQMSGNKF